MNRKTCALVVAAIVLPLLISGCVALVAGAAGGAGGYRWASGKLSFTTSNTISECHAATLSAFKDLSIKVTSDKTDSLSGRIRGVTETDESVAVDLEPQPGSITKLDVRVGFWGNRTYSTRVADAIKRHLR